MSTTLCVYQIVWVNSVGDDLQEFAPQFPFPLSLNIFGDSLQFRRSRGQHILMGHKQYFVDLLGIYTLNPNYLPSPLLVLFNGQRENSLKHQQTDGSAQGPPDRIPLALSHLPNRKKAEKERIIRDLLVN